MEEFHEADVLWPEDCRLLPSASYSSNSAASSNPPHRREQQQYKATTLTTSVPIGIPAPAGLSNSWKFSITCDASGGYYVTDENESENEIDPQGCHGQRADIVPPHLLLASRSASAPCHHMAFSVCAGHGRTLKGRDLSQVRDLVLRLAGFLEPKS